MKIGHMETAAEFTAQIVRDGKWFIAFSPEYREGNGQGLTEGDAVDSLRESMILLMEDCREDASGNLQNDKALIEIRLQTATKAKAKFWRNPES
jgi:hypothetical protein